LFSGHTQKCCIKLKIHLLECSFVLQRFSQDSKRQSAKSKKSDMGVFFSSLYNIFTPERDWRILMAGLDNAGKTTLLYKMKLNEVVTTIPTIGATIPQ